MLNSENPFEILKAKYGGNFSLRLTQELGPAISFILSPDSSATVSDTVAVDSGSPTSLLVESLATGSGQPRFGVKRWIGLDRFLESSHAQF
ncbi:hypothetical protein PZA11_000995 [Diplocarpon coronariae]